MQEFEEDFYAILGVEETATPAEIRKAYLRLAKKLHPDRYPNDPETRSVAQTEFAKVTRAHDIVMDPESRTEYDTLRALSKKRDEAEAQAQIQAQVPVQQPDMAHGNTNHELTPDQPLTRVQQAQTHVDEDNINIKWANKHLTRADDLYRKKRYQEAETAMKEAIRLVPNEPKFRNKLAEIYLARGWRTLAMTEVQAALRINPRDAEAKNLEAKIKAEVKSAQTGAQQVSKAKANFIDQIKNLFGGKKR